jgi:hypothetical protein
MDEEITNDSQCLRTLNSHNEFKVAIITLSVWRERIIAGSQLPVSMFNLKNRRTDFG